MLRLSFEAVDGFQYYPDETNAVNWLRSSHMPVRFAQSLSLVKREREYRHATFDSMIWNNIEGRLHVRIHPNAWEYQPNVWVAGVYQNNGGPYDQAIDGAGFCDLMEVSWRHEIELGWDTIEHEFGHMIQCRMFDETVDLQTFVQNFQYMGHGHVDKDPYCRCLNGMVLEAYPISQPYFPGLVGRSYQSTAQTANAKFVQKCIMPMAVEV